MLTLEAHAATGCDSLGGGGAANLLAAGVKRWVDVDQLHRTVCNRVQVREVISKDQLVGWHKKEINSMNTQVIHNPELKRHEIWLDGEKVGHSDYSVRLGELHLVHTEVDP